MKFIESPIAWPRAMPFLRSARLRSVDADDEAVETALSFLSFVLYLSSSNWLVMTPWTAF